jgi:hypothetical protein
MTEEELKLVEDVRKIDNSLKLLGDDCEVLIAMLNEPQRLIFSDIFGEFISIIRSNHDVIRHLVKRGQPK